MASSALAALSQSLRPSLKLCAGIGGLRLRLLRHRNRTKREDGA